MKPDDKDPVVEKLMEGLEPPQPPPELRSRALAAARTRPAGEAAPDVWSSVWRHKGLRLAWAATVVLLLAGHVLATISRAGLPTSVDPSLVAENRVDEDYVDLLRPIRISENVQPLVGLVAGTDVPIESILEGNPS
jgi:hypothetical protein